VLFKLDLENSVTSEYIPSGHRGSKRRLKDVNPILHGLFVGLILHGGDKNVPHVYREPFTPWASNFAQIWTTYWKIIFNQKICWQTISFADISIYALWRHQKLKFEYLLIFKSNWVEILYTYNLLCSLLESTAIFSKWRIFLLTSAFILHDVIKKLKFEYLLIFKSNRSEILYTYSLRCSLSESKGFFSNWRNILLTSAFLKN